MQPSDDAAPALGLAIADERSSYSLKRNEATVSDFEFRVFQVPPSSQVTRTFWADISTLANVAEHAAMMMNF